jgi:hypothetical protein
VLVDWNTFLKLFCIFGDGQIKQSEEINFWCRFFDSAITTCSEDLYLKLLEQLIRGRCLKKPIEATKLFAT